MPRFLTRQKPLLHLLVALVIGSPFGLRTLSAADKVFLWEVTGEKGTGYLLGSIHVAREDLYPLDQAIEKAFVDSETLVVEVDLNAEDQTAMQMQALQAGVYGDGRKLETQVTPETLTRFKSFLEDRAIPFAPFNATKPWFIAIALTAAEMMRLGYKPDLGIDRHFLNQAKETGKPVRALESADFQIQLLANFSDELQEKFLLHTLDEVEKTAETADITMTAWKQGNVEGIESVIGDAAVADDALTPLYEKLFDNRNIEMARKIAGFFDSGGSWFVVVGAGHLVTDTGIVRLLADRGFQVRQVSASATNAP